jgi:alpha/beta hydrolase family protein
VTSTGSLRTALLTLGVVFVLLVTTGWTAVGQHRPSPGPREAALRSWKQATVAGHHLPRPDGAPGAVAAFFRSLSRAQRRRLAARHPLVVGNLDGAPLALRYQANRHTLRKARDRERGRSHDPQLTQAGRQLAGHRMHRFASLLRHGRQILAFDPTGSGRAAEVFGDLAHADRVSVVVPGVGTNLLTFERTRNAYRAPVGKARALQDAQQQAAPGQDTATVAWAGYTAPAGLGVDAASSAMAQSGARRLLRFVAGLPGHSPVTLVCHSYGSVVCGLAAPRLPRRVTDLAAVASPGMRADTVGDLHAHARVWAMRDRDDWIADVPHMELGGLGLGADPVAPAFGARLLSASGARGHDGYFVPGTRSLANLAALGTGHPDRVRCAADDHDCTAGAAGRA